MHMNQKRVIAYFFMEIAIEPDIQTYSGGLDVLAGDATRSAADPGIPVVSVGQFGGFPTVAGQRLNASSR
jgi:glucan phosphorylase